MARELEVWLFAERVGTLALTEGRLNFRYAPDWLALTDAFTLSSSLLLKAEPSACPPPPDLELAHGGCSASASVHVAEGECAD